MKRKRNVIILVGAAWLVLGCTDGGQYAQVLDRAERQNQNWDSITGIDSIQMAVKYVDRHGSSNEKVRAHYLLGCAYRDAGEAMNALEAYHEAADRADTTSVDCDYGQLMKVHSQSAELFKSQLLPYEMLEELDAQRRYAIKAGNMKAAINALERSADAYYLLNKPDSVISLRMQASKMYEQCGFTEEAAQAVGPCIEPLVDRGDTAKARRCIERYESSKNFYKDGELLPRKLVHYYAKGKYYLATNQTDSAEVCFRKLIKPGLNAQQLEAGYRGMFLLYRTLWATHRGQAPLCPASGAQDGASPRVSSPRVSQVADSMAKYADLQYEMTIPALAEKSKENIQQMQRLYNYSRIQHEAKKSAEKSEQQEGMILILVVAAVVLALIVFGIMKIMRIILRRPRIEKLADQIVVSNEGRVMYG